MNLEMKMKIYERNKEKTKGLFTNDVLQHLYGEV
jgi:hypothetical protein